MALTNEIKRNIEFRDLILNNITNKFTITENKHKFIKNVSKKYDLVGSAVDYLIRFKLAIKYNKDIDIFVENTNAHKAIKIIKPSIIIDEQEKLDYGLLNSILSTKHKYRENTFDLIFQQYESYRKVISKYVRKNMDNEEIIIPIMIYFSKLDKLNHDLDVLPNAIISDKDIDDINVLMPSIDYFVDYIFKNNKMEDVIDNYNFKFGAIFGGAECDLICGDTLIDIKTTKNLVMTQYMICQLIGYYFLALKEGKTINKLGIYFTRYKYLHLVETKDLFKSFVNIEKYIELTYIDGASQSELNNKQELMVETPKPLMVIAGPGSGKTHTLIAKILKDLENIKIEEVFIASFTKKAANEIKTRLQYKKKNLDVNKATIGTFHSIYYKILKEELETYKKHNLLLPDDDRMLIYSLFAEVEKISVKEVDAYCKDNRICRPKEFYDIINMTISKAIIDKDKIINKALDIIEYNSVGTYRQVLEKYFKIKENENLMNFADILRFMYKELLHNINFRLKMKNKYKAIYIDEFQDTSKIQFKILGLIYNDNACVIGDPYQSIYGFQNANVENIFDFKAEFKPNIVQLNRNYRSTPKIVALTNAITNFFIDDIEEMYDINLEPLISNQDFEGDPIELYSTSDKENKTLELIQNDLKEGMSLDEIAIIVRNNVHSSKLERLLSKNNIDYKKISGMGFYETEEIQILINLVLFWYDRNNYTSFRNLCVAYPNLGVETANAWIEIAKREKKEINSWILDEKDKTLQHKRNKEASIICETFNKYNIKTLSNFINIFTELKLIENIKNSKKTIDEEDDVQFNVEEFMEILKDEILISDITLEQIRDLLDEMMNTRTNNSEEDDVLTITTAHSAKGLEWNRVIIMDVSKNNFTENIMDNCLLNDEQIRLLYVAISRARNNLKLIWQNLKADKKPKDLDYVIKKCLKYIIQK